MLNRFIIQSSRRIPMIRVRSFSITEKVIDFATNRIEKTKEKQFQQMVEAMTQTNDWTLKKWKTIIEQQLSSWLMYIPGFTNQDDISKVKTFKALLDSMSEAELDNPDLINGAAKERIAASTGQSVEIVAQLLFYYKQTRILSTWLKMRKSCNDPLPANEMEMVRMQEEDLRLRTISNNILNSKGKRKSGRGRSLPF